MSYDVIQNKQKSKKKKITESICFSKISVNNINWHNLPAEVGTIWCYTKTKQKEKRLQKVYVFPKYQSWLH